LSPQQLAVSSLYNTFAVWREILQGITAFTSLLERPTGKFPFRSNDVYFEDEPNNKAYKTISYPHILIDSDMNDSHITFTGLKEMDYTTRLIIRTEYFAERDSARLMSYMNAIVTYLNANQTTLLNSYGIDGLRITLSRDRDVIAEKELVVGIITLDYKLKLDVEA